jgi:hypothetical protein
VNLPKPLRDHTHTHTHTLTLTHNTHIPPSVELVKTHEESVNLIAMIGHWDNRAMSETRDVLTQKLFITLKSTRLSQGFQFCTPTGRDRAADPAAPAPSRKEMISQIIKKQGLASKSTMQASRLANSPTIHGYACICVYVCVRVLCRCALNHTTTHSLTHSQPKLPETWSWTRARTG